MIKDENNGGKDPVLSEEEKLQDALDRVVELEIMLNDVVDALGLDPDTPYEEIVEEIGYRWGRNRQ